MNKHPEECIIREGRREDIQQAYELIRELALFEKAPQEVTNTAEQMERDGFGTNPAFSFLVATMKGKIIGMALYFVKYSTWKGKGLYLDDLIVTEKMRGQGIGRMLFDAFMIEAKKINARQVHWQVLDWNTPAIEFYRKLNASVDPEWLDCKLDEQQIKNYRSGHNS
jgi:GNAT superfamily N-acetyltransferase